MGSTVNILIYAKLLLNDLADFIHEVAFGILSYL